MLGASLAGCTFSVLLSWAGSAGLEYDDLEVDLAWEVAEDPYRIGRYEMAILWPSLPPDRYGPAKSVAAQCRVERTLRIPPEIEVSVGPGDCSARRQRPRSRSSWSISQT